MSVRRVTAKTAARGVRKQGSCITHAKSRATLNTLSVRNGVIGGVKRAMKISIRG